MKLVTFLTFFVLGFLLSCGKKSDPKLIVTMTPDSSQVLETNGYSCQGKIAKDADPEVRPDMNAPTISFKGMSIEWTKDTELYVQVIKIILKGSGLNGGEQVCTFGVDEITALFAHSGNPDFTDNTIKAKGVYSTREGCRVTCGSISLLDPNDVEINASGQIIIKATEIDGDKYRRVTATGSVRISP